MKQITAKEFLAMIKENPSVFEDWETPLEIAEFVNCNYSPITQLSPLLTFSGKDMEGNCATFTNCPDLQIATGTFHGCTDFGESGVQKIENLHIKETNDMSWASMFWGCKNLQVATGNYPGFVTFYGSGIHSIQNLKIQNPDKWDYHAEFRKCPNLHTLQGWDLSKPIGIEPEKWAAEKARRALQKFHKTTQPKELPFL
jgi:hypothetical protein